MNVQNETPTKTNKMALIIINILFGVSLMPAVVMAIFSPMLFDAPGSEKSSLTWFLLYGILSFPVLIIISIIATWIFYFTKNYKLALWVSLSPLLSIAWIILAFILIIVLQNGNFTPK
jgi:uncharacterized BrkB/YihY/UPF0761 family membrane protein